MDIQELCDRQEISILFNTYNSWGDRGRIDEMSKVFAPDAYMETPQWQASGLDNILYALGRPRSSAGAPGDRMRHHLTTSLVTFNGPDEATGRTYWTRYSDTGPDHSGFYADTVRRIDGKWKIVKRSVRVDWRATPGRMDPEVVGGGQPEGYVREVVVKP